MYLNFWIFGRHFGEGSIVNYFIAYSLPLSPGQTIATCQRNISQHCWAQHVACVWPPCCDVLGVVGSNLAMIKFEPTTPNMSQLGGQTHATCCPQHCCDMLRWHVAIVWPGLYRRIWLKFLILARHATEVGVSKRHKSKEIVIYDTRTFGIHLVRYFKLGLPGCSSLTQK